jgi:hypothetical protein
LRFYIFIALLCGFAAYQSLLKRSYLRLLEIVVNMIISIYQFTLKAFKLLIYRPIYSLIITLISLIVLIGKGIFGLFMFLCKVLLFILKVLWTPFKWVGQLIWYLLPKRIKKIVEKLYNKMAGYLRKIKKLINNRISKWKNRE